MTDDQRAALEASLDRLYRLVCNLAHPNGDHCENELEDEAHDIIFELRSVAAALSGSSAADSYAGVAHNMSAGSVSQRTPTSGGEMQGTEPERRGDTQ